LKFDWKKYSPKLHKAVIRGADDLVEDGSLSSLPDEHARAKLTDMESAGFALACHQLEQPWMVWRGVADVGQMPRTKGYQFISTLMSVLMSLSFMSQYERDVFGAAQ
jgi:nucleoside phosphorylase